MTSSKTKFFSLHIVITSICVFVVMVFGIYIYQKNIQKKYKNTIQNRIVSDTHITVVYAKNQLFWGANIDGSNKIRLTDEDYSAIPYLSPNGKTLALRVSTDKLILIDTRSANKMTFPVIPSYQANTLTWSPDSKTLSYSGSNDAFLIDATDEHKRTLPTYINNFDIWSPDSKEIAIFYYKKGSRSTGFSNVDIYTENGKKEKTLQLQGAISNANILYWLLVNNTIYFTHSLNGVNYALWSSNIDGTNEKLIAGRTDSAEMKLIYHFSNPNSPIVGSYRIAISYDGKKIVFLRKDNTNAKKVEVWTMNTDGTDLQRHDALSGYNDVSTLSWIQKTSKLFITNNNGSVYITDLSNLHPIKLN